MNWDQIKQQILKVISTNEISLLKDLSNKITIYRNGKFCYHKFLELDSNSVWKFLHELEEDQIYSLIPFISANDKPNEPYIILSQSILITSQSSSQLISQYVHEKCMKTLELYNIDELKDIVINFKYKKVDIKFEEVNNRFI